MEKNLSGWQPMDTVPKAPEDGPECWKVLGCYPGGLTAVVYWAEGGWYPADHDVEEPWLAPSYWMAIPDLPDDLW